MINNPSKRLDALLAESGAILVRDKNHLVYNLPNGGVFTMAKTPSDRRVNLNSLSDLRRRAGLTTAAPPEPPRPQPAAVIAAPAPPDPQPIAELAPPQPATADPATPLAQHLDAIIADGEAMMISLTDQAADIERQVAFLKSIRTHADDPFTPALLALLVPQQQQQQPTAPTPPQPPPPPPPPPTTVTRTHIESVIAEFPETFTIQDLYDRCVHSPKPPHEERRLKNLIAMQLHHMSRNGEGISRFKAGRGGTMTIWQKDDPAKLGTRVEISSHNSTADQPHQETTECP